MLAPRPLTIHGRVATWEKVAQSYVAADAGDKLRIETGAPLRAKPGQ